MFIKLYQNMNWSNLKNIFEQFECVHEVCEQILFRNEHFNPSQYVNSRKVQTESFRPIKRIEIWPIRKLHQESFIKTHLQKIIHLPKSHFVLHNTNMLLTCNKSNNITKMRPYNTKELCDKFMF